MRGKHVSRPIEDIVKEAENLAAQGVKEIMVIAQDSTYYGIDLYGERKLAKLLLELEKVDGIEWIRLHYAYPSGFPMEVLDVMAQSKKICRYLDIPLQHGADKILKLMRRGITRSKTESLVSRIREAVPGIAIRTTLIAGHPGETKEDFEEMVQFVEDMRFERLGVFTYSHEENTHSFTMEDNVPQEIKQERADEIMEIQQQISQDFNDKLVGKKLKVLIDRAEGDYFVGRTEFDSPEVDNEVLINKEKNYLRIGDFVEVLITSAEDFDLYGTVE
jgi:ribosomal protein S12 methylthiotransferase